MFLRYSFLFFFVFISNSIYGQSWNIVSSSETEELGIKDIEPQKGTIYSINDNDIRNLLWSAEKESARDVKESSTIISVGMPDGVIENYKIVQYDIMESELAANYPDIRTYYGVSTGDRLKRIRIDYTNHGFRAVISSPEDDKIFIDHYQRNDKNTRIAYYKKDYKKVPTWGCNVSDSHNIRYESTGQRIGDCKLRSYRLAQATTAEYSNYHGATSSAQSSLVLSAVVTVINRINEVYEAEVAVRLLLVNNTNQVFYYNSATDPYTNTSSDLNANQTTCNNVIGSANYDIGHLFGTGGGGVAQLQSVCSSTGKARGLTGSGSPVGDPFSIDYVAHEMGHQFGGNHTQYNNCNRSDANAMEPGSASTIMGYAGICSPNVQNNSDAYFHATSLSEIKTFLSGSGNSCSATVSLPTNNPPTLSTVSNFSIPISTPFVLTLNATDPQGHAMTYTWDQMNSFSSPAQTMPPVSTNTTGPMFRSIFATTSPSRYFPPLANVINNTTNTYQVLPSVARSMSFRGVVRDFTGVFGCNNEVNITVSTVNAAAGAFSVTSFNTASTWAVGENKTITWNVAGTTASPINAANVDILFSTDGGLTYPITLATATPNDGTHSILVPNTTTTQGRFMVKGTNHVFYDINNASITINGVVSSFDLSATPSEFSICSNNSISSSISVIPSGSFNSPVTLSISGLPAGATATFSANPVNPGASSTINISGISTGGSFVINGVSGTLSKTTTLSVTVLSAPGTINQLLPANLATNQSLTPQMTWTALSGALSYDFEVAYDQGFEEKIATINGAATSFQISNPILGGTTLYWRVRANNICGSGNWTQRSFTVEPCYFYTPTDIPLNLPLGIDTKYSNLLSTDKGNVYDVNVLSLSGNYSFVPVLKFTLVNPASNTSLFWESPCGKDQLYNLQFDDSATTTTPCPPTTGLTYTPTNPLNSLNNSNLKGNWQLMVERSDPGPGEVTTWGIKACATQFCRLIVDHNRQDGPGSLKEAIACAVAGDTIRFAPSLANDTIDLKGLNLVINKHLIIESSANQNIFVSTDSQSPTITNNTTGLGLILKGINILGPNTTNGTLIINNGNLTLENIKLHKSTNSTATIINQGLGVLNIAGMSEITND